MKVFEVSEEKVTEGAEVEKFRLACGVEIPAVLVGEKGRGRKLGVLPVQFMTDEKFKKTKIFNATLGHTQTGKPKLVEVNEDGGDEAIVVFRTPIGFRGYNRHTGVEKVMCEDCKGSGKEGNFTCYKCKGSGKVYAPFPGKVLVEGIIAQGEAGLMGEGSQLIAVVPKGQWIRVFIGGRRYGRPSKYFYLFNGKKVIVATGEDFELFNDEIAKMAEEK